MSIADTYKAGDLVRVVYRDGIWRAGTAEARYAISPDDILIIGNLVDNDYTATYLEVFHMSGRLIKVYHGSEVWYNPDTYVCMHED